MIETNDKFEKQNWIQKLFNNIFGHSWSNLEIAIVMFATFLVPLVLPLYATCAGWNWTLVQKIAAFAMAFDIMGGCVVYNSFCFKKIRHKENDVKDYVKHALIHMQPLLVAVFYTEHLLPWVTIYWLVLYLTFIGLFEPTPRVGKLTAALVSNTLILINFGLLVLCYLHVQDTELFLYGAFNYLSLIVVTLLQVYAPVRAQRLLGATIVIIMSIVNVMLLEPPAGFEWFMPVLYVKLCMGYNARENIID